MGQIRSAQGVPAGQTLSRTSKSVLFSEPDWRGRHAAVAARAEYGPEKLSPLLRPSPTPLDGVPSSAACRFMISHKSGGDFSKGLELEFARGKIYRHETRATTKGGEGSAQREYENPADAGRKARNQSHGPTFGREAHYLGSFRAAQGLQTRQALARQPRDRPRTRDVPDHGLMCHVGPGGGDGSGIASSAPPAVNSPRVAACWQAWLCVMAPDSAG